MRNVDAGRIYPSVWLPGQINRHADSALLDPTRDEFKSPLTGRGINSTDCSESSRLRQRLLVF